MKKNSQPAARLHAMSRFYSTSDMFQAFSAHCRAPKPSDKIIFFVGSWDVFNANHVLAMEKAKELGDYLLVGIYSDDTVFLRIIFYGSVDAMNICNAPRHRHIDSDRFHAFKPI